MDINEKNVRTFKSMVIPVPLPPKVHISCFIENGTRQVAAGEWPEYENLFNWVNFRDIYQRLLRLQQITLKNEQSIIAIYADSRTIIEFARKDLTFVPPVL